MLIPPDESIQFGFDHSPAASDSPGFDTAGLNIFEVSRAGNVEIIAGFLCAEYRPVIERGRICIGASIIAVAAVGKLAAVITSALFYPVFVYHRIDLEVLIYPLCLNLRHIWALMVSS
jgi:hypothetical protein